MAQQITSLLDDPTQAVSLDTFSGLTKGCPAPFWLFQGVCAAWGIDHQRAQLNLITVSENATFLLLLDGEPPRRGTCLAAGLCGRSRGGGVGNQLVECVA